MALCGMKAANLELISEVHSGIARALKILNSLRVFAESNSSSYSHSTVSLSHFLHGPARCSSRFCGASRSTTRSRLETSYRTRVGQKKVKGAKRWICGSTCS